MFIPILPDIKIETIDGVDGVLRLGRGGLLYCNNIYYGDQSVVGPEGFSDEY